jgi:hypothetical protein
MFFRGDYFCLMMALVAAGLYGRHCTVAPSPSVEPHLEVRGKVAYAWLGRILEGGAKNIVLLS